MMKQWLWQMVQALLIAAIGVAWLVVLPAYGVPIPIDATACYFPETATTGQGDFTVNTNGTSGKQQYATMDLIEAGGFTPDAFFCPFLYPATNPATVVVSFDWLPCALRSGTTCTGTPSGNVTLRAAIGCCNNLSTGCEYENLTYGTAQTTGVISVSVSNTTLITRTATAAITPAGNAGNVDCWVKVDLSAKTLVGPVRIRRLLIE